MVKQTAKIVFYLIIALVIGVVITLVTDSIENVAVEKRIRQRIEADLKNALASFKETAPRSSPDDNIAFIKKYVATVMTDEVVARERSTSGSTDVNSGLLFLFTIVEKNLSLDIYIQNPYLKSELALLDVTDYISGIVTTIIVFTFILVYSEHRKRSRTLQYQFEAKYAELSQALEKTEVLALLGRMSATLAHELKTPLSTISNLVHVLPSRISDEQFMERFLKLVREELDRSEQLIDNLLAYGKEIELRNEAWMSLKAHLKPASERYQVAIAPEVPADVEILGDRFYLGLLFQNILRNSREAGADRISVTLSFHHRSAETLVEISLEDNGKGYPDNVDLDELTNPFVTSRSRGGGLGLYLAKKIVQAHDGTLSLYRMERGAGVKIILAGRRIRTHG